MTTPEQIARETTTKICTWHGLNDSIGNGINNAILAALAEAAQDRAKDTERLENIIKNRDGEIAMLRELANGYTVSQADYDRLYKAAMWLRRSCKDRLPPGQYDKLSEECAAIDDAARAKEKKK